jgi:hypothetical protein
MSSRCTASEATATTLWWGSRSPSRGVVEMHRRRGKSDENPPPDQGRRRSSDAIRAQLVTVAPLAVQLGSRRLIRSEVRSRRLVAWEPWIGRWPAPLAHLIGRLAIWATSCGKAD